MWSLCSSWCWFFSLCLSTPSTCHIMAGWKFTFWTRISNDFATVYYYNRQMNHFHGLCWVTLCRTCSMIMLKSSRCFDTFLFSDKRYFSTYCNFCSCCSVRTSASLAAFISTVHLSTEQIGYDQVCLCGNAVFRSLPQYRWDSVELRVGNGDWTAEMSN